MNKNIIGSLIGILLIVVALIPNNIIPNIKPIPKPEPAINLEINEPTQDILLTVNPINELITNKDDKIKVAVFNYVFSKRINSYNNIDVQKMNDVYVYAAEAFFGNSIKGKYKDLDNKIKTLFVNIVGEDNHILTENEKVLIKNVFSGLSWRLIK